ncbi:large ribosomal subunit protein mL54 isoform X1 [Ictidomys tridecemlineatus]
MARGQEGAGNTEEEWVWSKTHFRLGSEWAGRVASGPRNSACRAGPRCPGLAAVAKGAKGGKGSVVSEALKDPEVCTDPVRLTTHAMGVNIYKAGQDVALKPDAEYPEWLFQVNVGSPKKLEELDPETREYWRLLRKLNIWRHNRLSKGRKL